MSEAHTKLLEAMFGPREEIKTSITELIPLLDAAVARLEEYEQNVIKSRFGLYRSRQTLVEVGARYGKSRERIRRIESRALLKLKQPTFNHDLRSKVFIAEDNHYRKVVRAKQRFASGEILSDNDLADIKLDEFWLTVRASNCLKNENINSLLDIKQYRKSELLRIPNFGPQSLHEIESVLIEFGIHLA